jgi:dUTP pyrophosphatase
VNLGSAPIVIRPGDRIAQLVIAPVARAELVEANALEPSSRGGGGFGHTGR